MKKKFKKVNLVIVAVIGLILIVILVNRASFNSRFVGVIEKSNFNSKNAIFLNKSKLKITGLGLTKKNAIITNTINDYESETMVQWKANFPWKPTHDPNLKFNHNIHLIDRDQVAPMSETDMFTGANHYVLKKFFNDNARFSTQFKKFYEILTEHDRGHDPVAAAAAFFCLRRYYYAAYEHDDNELINLDDPGARLVFNAKNWGEESEQALESLHVGLIRSVWHRPEFLTQSGRNKAYGLIEQLLDEVVGMDELPPDVMRYSITSGLSSQDPEAAALLSGEEELLVPYVGWTEEHAKMESVQRTQFQTSYEQGDPSLKKAAPELFPPVGVKNGQLVDKDGDPVKWSANNEISLINERGERVPVIIEDDGSISLPTPEEVEFMRQSGDVRQANWDEAAPIIQAIMEMSQPSQ